MFNCHCHDYASRNLILFYSPIKKCSPNTIRLNYNTLFSFLCQFGSIIIALEKQNEHKMVALVCYTNQYTINC